MITQKQETDRTKGIGSSDVPTILGLNPWSNAYDLWLFKTGQMPGAVENEAMRIGTLLESGVLQLAADRLGVKIVKPTATFVGCDFYMRANVDGMIGVAKRGSEIVEAKTTGRTEGWGAEGTDEVPEAVKAQVTFQMMCASSEVCHVACLQGDHGLRLKMYRVPFNMHYADYIRERVKSFWNDNVLKRVAPDCLPSLDALKRRHRDESLPPIRIDPNLFLIDAAAQQKLKAAEAVADEARATLLETLGNAAAGEGGGYRIRVTQVETSRFNAKGFAEEQPEIAERWMIRSAYSRTVVIAPKGIK